MGVNSMRARSMLFAALCGLAAQSAQAQGQKPNILERFSNYRTE
jgi:hypothetical protein